MNEQARRLWDKVHNHPSVCTCTDCRRWLKIEQELTARSEQQAYRDQNATVKVECEACGASYEPEHGYYEAGEYSYCSGCCNW